MKIAIILLLVLSIDSFPCMAQSGVYKHVNQDGHTFYSDTEIKDASEIDLPEITVLPVARQGPASLAIKKGVTLPEQNEIIDKKMDHEIKQLFTTKTTHQNSFDKNVSELSDQDRVQQIIEEMALHEDSIEALEIELYNLKGSH